MCNQRTHASDRSLTLDDASNALAQHVKQNRHRHSPHSTSRVTPRLRSSAGSAATISPGARRLAGRGGGAPVAPDDTRPEVTVAGTNAGGLGRVSLTAAAGPVHARPIGDWHGGAWPGA